MRAVGGFVRKLREMKYNRSAKKCKEKFENVHKYYKRTKDGRAGRQDGKSYRFFSQLEALHSGGGGSTGSGLSVAPAAIIPAATFQPPLPATPISVGNPMVAPGRIQTALPPITGTSQLPSVVLPPGISFSTSSGEEGEEDESEEEEEEEAGGRKRKMAGASGAGSSSSSKKMMSFFEGLIKQVMERQEAMQQRFLEMIEKREQDRMMREDAWKRKEMARLTREHEERAMATSRDAAVIGFLQKITGQTIPTATVTATITSTLPPPTPPSTVTQPLLHPSQTISFQQPAHDIIAGAAARRHLSTSSTAETAADQGQRVESAAAMTVSSFDTAASSSRWPKAEVHALIQLRSGLETKYLEAGPKGPLWEDISAEMRRIGYNRSSKRCKEKWENINKYFKKVKESNKKRPEDAKTCPYFHQLDTLYKKKLIGSAAGSSAGQTRQDHQGSVSSIISPPLPEPGAKDNNNNMSNNSGNKASGGHDGGSNAGSNVQIQTSNGDLPPTFFQEDQGAIKKPEDIMKELMEQQQQQSVMDDYDSDNLEVEEDVDELDNDGDGGEDDDEEKKDEKMAFKIQFQRQGPAGSSSKGGGGNVGASPAATSAGSFLAVVQ